jgi:hypothetical protein
MTEHIREGRTAGRATHSLAPAITNTKKLAAELSWLMSHAIGSFVWMHPLEHRAPCARECDRSFFF